MFMIAEELKFVLFSEECEKLARVRRIFKLDQYEIIPLHRVNYSFETLETTNTDFKFKLSFSLDFEYIYFF